MKPRRISGNRTAEDIPTKHYQEQAEAITKPRQEPPQVIDTSIQSQDQFWTIAGVNYRNGIYQVDLSKSLLEGTKTQDQWAEYSRQARINNQFYVGDSPLHHALFRTLYNNREGPKKQEIEEIRAFLQDKMRKHLPATLTRVRYKPQGEDEILHSYKQDDQYSVSANMVGKDGKVTGIEKAALKAVLDDDNRDEIDAVYRWINNTDVFLWRLNQKPESLDERVVVFDAVSVGVDLYCGRVPLVSSSAFGVRVAKIST